MQECIFKYTGHDVSHWNKWAHQESEDTKRKGPVTKPWHLPITSQGKQENYKITKEMADVWGVLEAK